MSALPDPMLIATGKGRILFANSAASELFGRPSATLASQSLSALVADDPQKLAIYLRQCARNSQYVLGALSIHSTDGGVFTCRVEGALIDPADRQTIWLRITPRNGARQAFSSLTQRISSAAEKARFKIVSREVEEELWRSERRFQTLIENIEDYGIFILDSRGRVMSWNAGAERMSQYASRDVVGLHYEIFFVPEDRLADKPNILLREAAAFGRVTGKSWRVRKNGARFWANTAITAIRDRTGRLIGFAKVMQDMTETLGAEEALREARSELAHITRLTTMGELAASIAHEIRQPLAAITTNADACLRWLKSTPDGRELRAIIRQIVADADRASKIIDGIRAFINKSPPERVAVQINDVIRDVLALVESEIAGRGATIRSDLSPHLPAILGDRVQLQQVLLNLIINGMEAMQAVENRPRLIEIVSRSNPPSQIHVSVCDNGVGFDQTAAGHLFKAFYTTKPGGMGMGLAICRSIIEAHGGELSAVSNAPHGACFQFTLPIHAA